MRAFRAILPVVVPFLFCVYVFGGFFESAWTTHWVWTDARLGKAIAVGHHWSGHGSVIYEYDVNGQTYTGHGGNSQIAIGDRIPVYYSASHPWLSRLFKPESSPFALGHVTIIACVFALGMFLFHMNWRYRRARRAGLSVGWDGKVRGRVVSRDVQMRVQKLKSLDDVPPELREKLAEALGSHHKATHHPESSIAEEGEQVLEDVTIQTVSEGVTLVDGKMVLDEFDLHGKLPRHFLESLEGAPTPVKHFTFTYQGPDGVKRTYHSLDEMPPDVRAMYDRVEAKIEGRSKPAP